MTLLSHPTRPMAILNPPTAPMTILNHPTVPMIILSHRTASMTILSLPTVPTASFWSPYVSYIFPASFPNQRVPMFPLWYPYVSCIIPASLPPPPRDHPSHALGLGCPPIGGRERRQGWRGLAIKVTNDVPRKE